MSSVIAQLMRKHLMTPEQLQSIREKCSLVKKSVQDISVEMGIVREEDLFDAALQISGSPTVDLDQSRIDSALIKLVPFAMARGHGIFPVQRDEDTLTVAMSDPSNVVVRDELRFVTDLEIKPVLCRKNQISEYIKKFYHPDTVQQILKNTLEDSPLEQIEREPLSSEEIVDLALLSSDNSSFIKLVHKIICDAVEGRASDVHIEPQEKNVEVRYRIDGYLKSVIKIPRNLHPRLAARIKILAQLDIAEQRKIQEGRIKAVIDGKKIDLRISVIPVFYGEKIVLRILESTESKFDLNQIGFERGELEVFKKAIGKTQGVILVTGPTGSGKTTTLYSALQHIKCETKNIMTIEDPIEYLIEGINQLQLSHSKDVNFSSGLKSILRQDPDVILVGEIRDKETAEIAFRASLTGHLVFSTLHTNNAASSVTRLFNLGLEPYFLSSSLVLLVSQRLVRMVCSKCRQAYNPDKHVLQKFKKYLQDVNIRKFYRGKGCSQCNFSGFYGRTSIFEILKVDDQIKDLIFNRASERLIFKTAVHNGMRSLIGSGVAKVAAGITTLEEVAKVTDVMEEREQPLVGPDEEKWDPSLLLAE